MEPPNVDMLWTQHFVLCREVVLVILYRVCIQWYIWFVLYLEVCPLSDCPLSDVSLYCLVAGTIMSNDLECRSSSHHDYIRPQLVNE